jgi:hypothetical protein
MDRPRYRLLVCDLDGTLLQDHHYVSDRARRAIVAARECGVHVTLATGRSYQSTLLHAQSLGIDQPLICYQGALIRDIITGQTLWRVTIEPDLVDEAIQLSQAEGWHLILYADEDIFLTEHRYSEDTYRQMLGPTYRRVNDLRSALYDGIIKVTFMADEGLTPTIEARMRQLFADRIEVLQSHPMFVEGLPRGSSKGSALAWLAQRIGVPQGEVMAIGDQDNDASMLRWARLGVAMGNGSQHCRQIADWIAPAIEEDGAAVAIERFVLPEG